MSYIDYFKLTHEPFSNAPDARFYFDGAQHQRTLRKLRFAVDSNKGLGVVVGPIGNGKTTLARRLLDQLPRSLYQSSLLIMVHSGVTPDWILTRIAAQMGVSEPQGDRLSLLRQLYDRLLEIETEGRRAVILIDEAQMLETRAVMEEFRGLLNLEIPGKKLLNIIFFGLPELEDNLRLDPPLAQRVAVRCSLAALTVSDTAAYIEHRLQVAGAEQTLFMSDAVQAVHHFSGGVPRLINTLCDNCLFEAFTLGLEQIDESLVLSVADSLGLNDNPGRQYLPEDLDDGLEQIESMLDRLEIKS